MTTYRPPPAANELNTNLPESPSKLALSKLPSFKPPSSKSRRILFLKWLRQLHGWIGLWGAVLGLLFGVTGILHNHRAVLKIELPKPVVSNIQLAVPEPAKANPKAMANWLQQTLKLDRPADRSKKEPATTVIWAGQEVQQPERWEIRFIAPQYRVQAEYWLGSGQVAIKRTEENWLGVLNNFHRATGAGTGWVLLADSIAGSLILLSITGVLLWTELHRRKTLGAVIFIASVIAMLVFGAASM